MKTRQKDGRKPAPLGNPSSAGRSDSMRCGVKGYPGLNMESTWLDFGKACDRWLVERVPGYRAYDQAGRDITRKVMNPGAPSS